MIRLSARLGLVGLALLVLASCAAAGKYQLAYWRELGAYENQAPPAGPYGMHDVWIHVWNEDGTPRGNVQIRNSSYFVHDTTNSNGIGHALLWSSASDFMCYDGTNVSEVSPIFDERRAPHWGHYSWEVGFVYRASSSPNGVFDTVWDGVLNSTSGDNCDIDAPCTRSLSFISTDPDEACSDPFTLSSWVTEAGQTFIAQGDRVIACKAWINGCQGFRAEILNGGPHGAVIGTVAVASSESSYQNILATWPFDAVPVTAGNTYYLKITSANGSAFQVQRTYGNTYSGGCFYENKNAVASCDMFGLVVTAWTGYGANGRLSGRVKDVNSINLANATVTAQPGSYSTVTNGYGDYTIYNVPPGVYTITASKAGYSEETLRGRAVVAGETATVNFNNLKVLTNLLTNPGFESDFASWTKIGSFSRYPDDSGQGFAVVPHGGQKWVGMVTCGGGNLYGTIYQQIGVSNDYEYLASGWFFTDAFANNRAQEWPTDNQCRLGVDPRGGTNKLASWILWSNWSSSHNQWSQLSVKTNAQPPYAQMTLFLDYRIPYTHEWNKAGFDDAFFGRSQPVVVIENTPSASSVSAFGATITWQTNATSDSRVDYGLTTAYGQSRTVSTPVTNHSVTLTGLRPSTTYHFKVTSGGTGYTSGVSGDYTFTTAPCALVSDIKSIGALPDQTEVQVPSKIVTAGVDQLGAMFYVQEAGSPMGIRVNSTDTAIHEGDVRTVFGTLSTVDGERCIDCALADLVSTGNTVPRPCGILAGVVGGVGAGRPYGVDNTGALLRTWGLVTATGADYFILTDAAGSQLKVMCGSLTKPSGLVAVTGACGKTATGGVAPVLRARKQSDITVY